MKSTKSTKLMLANVILFVVATVAAAYLLWHHYAFINGEFGYKSFCSINATFDCDAVNSSAYSEVLGVPLSAFALSYYIFALILSSLALTNKFMRRELLLALLPLSVFSLLVTIEAIVVMFFVVKKICIVCSLMQIINIATLVLTTFAIRDLMPLTEIIGEMRRIPGRRIVVHVIGLAALFVVIQGMSAQLRKSLPFEEGTFAQEFKGQPFVQMPMFSSNAGPRLGFQGDHPPVQIVEFFDYQCPACAMAANQMRFLLKRYGDRIQLLPKNFPLDKGCNPYVHVRIHDFACAAAKAAYCAFRQGHYEEYASQLFQHGHDVTPERLRDWASQMGIDIHAFDTCMGSEETKNALLADMDLANQLRVTSTPTFFVNGRRVEGPIDEARLKIIFHELGND